MLIGFCKKKKIMKHLFVLFFIFHCIFVQGAIQRNTTKQPTYSEIQGAVSRFLKGSVDREGGRRKRQRVQLT